MTDQVVPQGTKVSADRIRVAPNTVAYVEKHTLVLEFAIPGAPTETIDVKMLEDGVYLTAPARDIEYAAALPFGWPVKPGKAEASYEHGLLRISVPLKDPMEDAVKLAIKSGSGEPVIDATKNILHTDYRSTSAKLASLGLGIVAGGIYEAICACFANLPAQVL